MKADLLYRKQSLNRLQRSRKQRMSTWPLKAVKKLARIGLSVQVEPIQRAVRTLWFEVKANKIVKDSAPNFRALQRGRDLKIHLGCGPDIRRGWVNIDLWLDSNGVPVSHPNPHTWLINYDLRCGLPLANNSCALIYSSHFFEHLEYKDGLKLMQSCYSALQPHGVFRMVMPDFRKVFRAYLEDDRRFFSLIGDAALITRSNPQTEATVDYVNYAVYQFGEHKCIYDEDKLLLLLQDIGYKSVTKSYYKDDIDPGYELRQRYSFYIEAVK